MRAVRILLIGLAVLAAAGGVLRERRRLAVVRGLAGAPGRDYLERTRARNERFMWGVTAALLVGAAGSLVHLALRG